MEINEKLHAREDELVAKEEFIRHQESSLMEISEKLHAREDELEAKEEFFRHKKSTLMEISEKLHELVAKEESTRHKEKEEDLNGQRGRKLIQNEPSPVLDDGFSEAAAIPEVDGLPEEDEPPEKKGKAKKNRRRKRQERQRLEEKNTVISEAAAIPEVDWLPEEGEPVGRSRSPNLSDEDEPLPAGRTMWKMAQISIANPINIIYYVEQLELEWIEEEKKRKKNGEKNRSKRRQQGNRLKMILTVWEDPEDEDDTEEEVEEDSEEEDEYDSEEEDEYDSEEEDEYDSEEEDEDDSEEEDEDSEQDEEDSEEQEEEDSEHEEKDEKNPEEHKKFLHQKYDGDSIANLHTDIENSIRNLTTDLKRAGVVIGDGDAFSRDTKDLVSMKEILNYIVHGIVYDAIGEEEKRVFKKQDADLEQDSLAALRFMKKEMCKKGLNLGKEFTGFVNNGNPSRNRNNFQGRTDSVPDRARNFKHKQQGKQDPRNNPRNSNGKFFQANKNNTEIRGPGRIIRGIAGKQIKALGNVTLDIEILDKTFRKYFVVLEERFYLRKRYFHITKLCGDVE
ncbi:glutamic acid-rich protein-like [Macrobrachium nipponense]|uniref:glutamic acid-rich protein-like n=1 Tax=Macrobrachium nipponense TaxID=159736 RepID=UPI0030C7CF90